MIGGKFSFLILGATKTTIDAQPRLPEVIDKAMDEAARIIHDDPRRAAQIYLTHEPSGTLNGATMAAVIGDIKDDFGSAVYGVQAMADFMSRHGELKTPPAELEGRCGAGIIEFAQHLKGRYHGERHQSFAAACARLPTTPLWRGRCRRWRRRE